MERSSVCFTQFPPLVAFCRTVLHDPSCDADGGTTIDLIRFPMALPAVLCV